jgi:hypothetical protein
MILSPDAGEGTQMILSPDAGEGTYKYSLSLFKGEGRVECLK